MRAILDAISKRFFLITVIMLLTISVVHAAVTPIEIMATGKTYLIPLIFVWEYLVGKTTLVKANSTIEMVINFLKQILGISKSDLSI